MSDESDTRVKLALLNQQSENFKTIFDRFETVIDKMSTAATSFSGVIAVHDQKITQTQDQMKDLGLKISAVKKASDKKIEELRTNVSLDLNDTETELGQKIDTGMATVVENQNANHIKVTRLLGTHNTRLKNLEKWMWILIGGGIVIFFILQKIDINALLSRIF